MPKPLRLFLIALCFIVAYSCKKNGASIGPIPKLLDSLTLVSPNYTPNFNEYVNGLAFPPTTKLSFISQITDYGYYLSTNNGPMQKVSLGKTPEGNFVYRLSNLLASTLYVIKAYVVYAGNSYYAPIATFTTYTGTWKKLTNFANASNEGLTATSHGPSGFSVNGKGYAMFTNGDLYQYDVANDNWTPKKPFNLNIYNLQEVPHVFFTINNTAFLYFRGGIWKYDDTADNWTNILQQTVTYTGPGSSFVVNNKAYILQSFKNGYNVPSVVYDPVSNTIQSINMISTNPESMGFAAGNLVYILSSQPYYYSGNTVYPAFIYNTINDSYTKKDNGDDVGPFASRFGGISFNINGKAYVGEGFTGPFSAEYYVYDEQDSKVQQLMQPFSPLSDNLNVGTRYNGMAFVINGKAYVGFGDYGRTDFWEFKP